MLCTKTIEQGKGVQGKGIRVEVVRVGLDHKVTFEQRPKRKFGDWTREGTGGIAF